ncbi:MAG: aminodeoxychorismate lyase [Conexibacter sp.]|nr:aminodeoxychorismate lyase [Conexibacter sp.]
MSRRGSDRTPEEREAARREREARRAAREGRPLPPEPELPAAREELAAFGEPAPVGEPAAFDATPSSEGAHHEHADEHDPHADEHDPHATQQYDVTRDWTGELPPLAPPAGQQVPQPEPPAPAAPVVPGAAEEPPVSAADEPPADDQPPVAHEPPVADEPPVAHEPIDARAADDAHDLDATQQHDVTAGWTGETPPVPDAAASAAGASSAGEPGPASPEGPAVPVAGGPRSLPPLPDVSGPASARANPPAAPDWGTEWTDQHAAVDPPSEEHERPLGTRRIGAAERARLPQLHRPGRGRGGGSGRSGRLWGRGGGARRSAGGSAVGGGRAHPLRRWIALVLLVLAVAVVWFLFSLFQPFAGGGSGAIVVNIPRGSGVSQIGDLLERRGVISSSFFFRARATLSGDRSKLASGTFTMKKDMSYGSALAELTKTKTAATVPTVRVAIPEGRSRREATSLVQQDGLTGDYLAATRRSATLDPRRYGAPRAATLEGFLFPATYDLPRHAKVQQLVDDQLSTFRRNFATVDLSYAKSRHLSAFDVLTIASMVEREVSVAKERPLVAAVIYNRLRFKMPLGIDATLRFGLNDWTHPLTQSQINGGNPYNTRRTTGLPPGPIGSPGLASIKAAAKPAKSNYLYYVVKPGSCDSHAFSTNYQQFLADAAKYNSARQAAGGKSPTKC